MAEVATTTPTATTSTPTLTQVEERHRTITAEVAEQRSELSAVTTDSAVLSNTERNRIRNLTANISNRHEAAIARLEQISDRTARHLAQETTSDTSQNALRALQAARTALQNAATALTTIDEDIHTFVYSPDPLADWQRIQAIYGLSAQSIQDAKTALRIALNELQYPTSDN